MRNLKIMAAVAGALAAGSAFALTPAATNSAPIKLRIAGSSALQATFEQEFNTACAAGTANKYVSSSNNFRAYSCTLGSAAQIDPIDSSLAGQNVTIYYRAEGGSVWGVGPVGRPSIQVKQLVVDNACTPGGTGTPSAWPTSNTCTINSYTLASDSESSPSGHLGNAQVHFGISDVEPRRFAGENWVNANSGSAVFGTAALSNSELNTLDSQALIGATFAIAVNKNGSTAGVTNLARQDITTIFSGLAKNWNKIPNAARTGTLPAGGITLCRRDAGSGTQASASVFFNGTTCSQSSYTFPTATSGTLTVNTNNTTGTEISCINGTGGAIGILVYDTSILAANPNIQYVSIDGVAPSKINAANGSYDFWYEATANKGSVIAGLPNESLLADGFTARLQVAVPNNDSVVGLPEYNAPVFPISATSPVAIGSRGGNSCLTHQGKL